MRFRPPVEDTRSPGQRSLANRLAHVPEFIPNIQPNPEPVTPKTKRPQHGKRNESSELKASADTWRARPCRTYGRRPRLATRRPRGGRARLRDNRGVGQRSRRHVFGIVAWRRKSYRRRASRRQVQAVRPAWFLPTGTELSPRGAHCQGRLQMLSADPDQGTAPVSRP